MKILPTDKYELAKMLVKALGCAYESQIRGWLLEQCQEVDEDNCYVKTKEAIERGIKEGVFKWEEDDGQEWIEWA